MLGKQAKTIIKLFWWWCFSAHKWLTKVWNFSNIPYFWKAENVKIKCTSVLCTSILLSSSSSYLFSVSPICVSPCFINPVPQFADSFSPWATPLNTCWPLTQVRETKQQWAFPCFNSWIYSVHTKALIPHCAIMLPGQEWVSLCSTDPGWAVTERVQVGPL